MSRISCSCFGRFNFTWPSLYPSYFSKISKNLQKSSPTWKCSLQFQVQYYNFCSLNMTYQQYIWLSNVIQTFTFHIIRWRASYLFIRENHTNRYTWSDTLITLLQSRIWTWK
jgi:hypothetical protein